MATATSKVVNRLATRLNPLTLKLNTKSLPPQLSQQSIPSSSAAFPRTPFSRFARLPVELSCVVGSLVPLHSAIASAKMVSSLSSASDSWALVPQGVSMPL